MGNDGQGLSELSGEGAGIISRKRVLRHAGACCAAAWPFPGRFLVAVSTDATCVVRITIIVGQPGVNSSHAGHEDKHGVL